MLSQDLERVNGMKAGFWITSRLGGAFGSVTLQVPEGFEAYARIFHPAGDAAGERVTWAEVARRLGRTAHPEMQWHQLVGTADPDGVKDSEWDGQVPPVGSMPIDDLDRLCRILADYTSDPFHCYFGLCVRNHPRGVGTQSRRERRRWRLRLGDGRYHQVIAGPLGAVDQLVETGSGPPARQAPSLIWPADRAWFLATEVEYDSTLVGGSRALIEALLAAPGLEVLEVGPETRLNAFADKVNLLPEPPR